MIRNSANVTVTLAALLIPALTGCVGLHKSDPAPIPMAANAPSLFPAPPAPVLLLTSETAVPVPDLPAPPAPSAQPTPPPTSDLADLHKPARNGRHRGRKGEQELAERENHEHELHEKEADKGTEAAQSAATEAAQNQPAGQTKVTAPTPSGDLAQTTSIGQLTAGPAPDATGSRQQATNLIDATQRGVNSLKNLNNDQNKTVAQIRSFLDQAQLALQHGDVDGASTLATKAKTLLDELTGAS